MGRVGDLKVGLTSGRGTLHKSAQEQYLKPMSQASGGDEALSNEQNEAGEELDQLGGFGTEHFGQTECWLLRLVIVASPRGGGQHCTRACRVLRIRNVFQPFEATSVSCASFHVKTKETLAGYCDSQQLPASRDAGYILHSQLKFRSN